MMAKRLVTLFSLPLRLGGAAFLVFLAYRFPYVVLVLLVLAVLAALAGLGLSFAARYALRMRLRTRCVACDHRPLRVARICPNCHTPLLAGTIRELPPHVRLAVLHSAVALAWASGRAADDERSYLEALLKAAVPDGGERARLQAAVSAGLALEDLALPALTPAEAQQVLRAAASLATIDGKLLPNEVEAYEKLAERLGVASSAARAALEEHHKLAWGAS
jgi:uncharacterized membrane protein YebE (DUF533 family)